MITGAPLWSLLLTGVLAKKASCNSRSIAMFRLRIPLVEHFPPPQLKCKPPPPMCEYLHSYTRAHSVLTCRKQTTIPKNLKHAHLSVLSVCMHMTQQRDHMSPISGAACCALVHYRHLHSLTASRKTAAKQTRGIQAPYNVLLRERIKNTSYRLVLWS